MLGPNTQSAKINKTSDITLNDGSDGSSPYVEQDELPVILNQGLKGDKGDKGDTGDTGATGLQGLQGIKGDKGDAGNDGVAGVKGDKGNAGDDGVDGAQGLQGLQGIKGDKGDTGDTGLQGEPGGGSITATEFTAAITGATETFTLTKTPPVKQVFLGRLFLLPSEYSRTGANLAVTPTEGIETGDVITIIQSTNTGISEDGDSAYQVAINNGFVGTEADWLLSLKGGGLPTVFLGNRTTPATSPITIDLVGLMNGKQWAIDYNDAARPTYDVASEIKVVRIADNFTANELCQVMLICKDAANKIFWETLNKGIIRTISPSLPQLSAPVGFGATETIAESQATLNWTGEDANATTMEVYRDYIFMATVPAGTLTYIDNTVVPGATHEYAIFSTAASGYSNSDEVTDSITISGGGSSGLPYTVLENTLVSPTGNIANNGASVGYHTAKIDVSSAQGQNVIWGTTSTTKDPINTSFFTVADTKISYRSDAQASQPVTVAVPTNAKWLYVVIKKSIEATSVYDNFEVVIE